MKEGDKVQVINKKGAAGFLPSMPVATAVIPYGQVYSVFSVSNKTVQLVGMGCIEFYTSDFKIARKRG